jgi:hypothetical protein
MLEVNWDIVADIIRNALRDTTYEVGYDRDSSHAEDRYVGYETGVFINQTDYDPELLTEKIVVEVMKQLVMSDVIK